MADFLDISSSNISEAKVKDRFPLRWAFKIGQAYGISTDWIITGAHQMELGKEVVQESEWNESAIHEALNYILQEGNTYQRGAVKGYLNELVKEISCQSNLSEK